MPSVSRPGGTVCSVSDMVAISVGAIEQPPTRSATNMSGKPSTSTGGTIASIIAKDPQRTRVAGPRRHTTAPVTTPASMLPTAHVASSQPDTAREPVSSAKATVVTSAEPKSAPSDRHTSVSGSTVRHGIGSRVPPRRCRPYGGSVARWAAKA
jgi:hypothetical protein